MINYNNLIELIQLKADIADKGITFVNGEKDEKFCSYKCLYSKAVRILNTFKIKGLKPGDELVLYISDNEMFIPIFWAAILGGIIPIPVNIGNNQEHKLKLFKILDLLNRPHLIIEKSIFNQIEDFSEKQNLHVLEKIRRNLLFTNDIEEIEQSDENVAIYNPSGNDIAFIQFSSGSTGNPKGVVLTHENLITNIKAIIKGIRMNQEDSTLSWMPLTHDMGLIGFHLVPLCAGINQFILPTSLFIRRPILWLIKAWEHKLTILSSPNFGYNYFLKSYKRGQSHEFDLSSVRIIFNGAEPISANTCNEFLNAMEQHNLKRNCMFPVYGLAESSLAVTFPPIYEEFISIDLDRDSISLGQAAKISSHKDRVSTFVDVGYPVDNCSIKICDSDNNELEDGTIGIIQIKGKNVTSGYYNNIYETQKVITEDGWLNTGDLGFIRDRRLVVTGREKDIIFINGQNYYPHDIERIVENDGLFSFGEVVACGIQNHKTNLEEVGLFVLFKGSIEEFVPYIYKLKKLLSLNLGIDVQNIIPIRKIPKTTSGKVQRYRLAELYQNGEYKSIINELNTILEKQLKQIDNNLSEIELKLVEIFKTILMVDNIGLENDLFEYGINSITSMQIIAKISKEFNIEISFKDLMELNTVGKLADFVKNYTGLLYQNIYPAIEPNKQQMYDPFPLTDIQSAYLLGRDTSFEIGGVSTHYYMEIKTSFDINRLNDGINKIIKRHPMLRAVFSKDGQQNILCVTPEYKIAVLDLSSADKKDISAKIMEKRERMSQYMFEVDKWPLFEICAIKISDTQNYLFINIDMLIADGASIQIFGSELVEFYKGSNLDDTELEFSFRDYVLACGELTNSKIYKDDKEFWLNKIDNIPSFPLLPLKGKPENVLKPRFKRLNKIINGSLWSEIKKKALESRITPSALLCTAYAQILSYWSNQKNLTINLTAFNRYPFHEDVNKVIGDFTSVILLGLEMPKDNFINKAKYVQSKLFEALQQRHYDGVAVIRELAKRNELSKKAVMPIVFTSLLFDYQKNSWNDIGEIEYAVSQTSQVYLDNQVLENDGELYISWDYVEELFDNDDINAMFEQYIELITSFLKSSDDFLFIPTRNDQIVIDRYNETEEEIRPTLLHNLFVEQCKKTPKNISLICNDEILTYEDLDSKSNQIAHYLKNKGIGRNDLIGVYVERTFGSIINILGILKSGAAYVPIEPEYPEERKTYILSNSQCKMLLQPDLYKCSEVTRYPVIKINNINEVNDLAYVIYTSGSTGAPKGVMISHAAAVNTIIDINKKFGVNEEDRILGISSMCFDLSVYDIFGSLSTGAILVLLPDQRDVSNLERMLEEKKITVWNSVPAIMDMLLDNVSEEFINYSLRLALLSGDWIPVNLPNKIKKHFNHADVISLGGATEASIWSIYYPIEKVDMSWKSIPYGMPLANQKIYILNYDMCLCPIGIQGEIFIGGLGVAQGYMNDSEKTRKSFINHPIYGYIYRTGDYGILQKDGYVEFLGRKDFQVKINGYRIELGEIEKWLLEYNNVKNAVVIDRFDQNGKKYLCAYLVSVDEINNSDLRSFLSQKLPNYMIPKYFVKLDKIPLSSNGKVNKKILPEPDRNIDTMAEFVAPSNEVEKSVAKIWMEVLGNERISIDDNFFDLGGDSLQAQKIINRIEREFNVKVPIRNFFTEPTIAQICKMILVNQDDFTVEKPTNDKFIFWSPIMQWEETEKGILIDKNYYSILPINLFTKYYFIVQKGITIKELISEFENDLHDKILELTVQLIENRVLVSSLLNPQELFSSQQIILTKSNNEEMINNSEEYNEFKRMQLNRENSHNEIRKIELNRNIEFPEHICKRQSYRKFDEEKEISFEDFSKFLSIFKQIRDGEKISYFYASAGGLYPIDVYIYIKADRVENIGEGLYYYNPIDNSIVLINDDCKITQDAYYYRNKSIFTSSAFSTFLIYNSDVNMPIYGTMGYYYACIETGIMVATLTQAAQLTNIGLCSIGEIDFSKIENMFYLNSNQVLLHTIEGGIKSEGSQYETHQEISLSNHLNISLQDEKIEDCYPLSSAQKRLFVLQKMDEKSTAYNNQIFYIVEGKLEKDKLEQTFEKIIKRHDALRTSFEIRENKFMQKINKIVEFKMDYLKGNTMDLEDIVNNFIEPFDLSNAPLLRVRLIELQKEKYFLLIDVHHIIADHTSKSILIKEINEIFKGKELSDLKYQYNDYIYWYKQLLNSESLKRQEQYWLSIFSDEIPIINLPLDFQRQHVQNFEGDKLRFFINEEMKSNFKMIVAKEGATLYMGLLGVFVILLSMHSGQEDIIVGTPVAGRQNIKFEEVIGMFVNTIAIRNKIDGDKTFIEFLRSVKKNALQAYANSDYPLEELIEKLSLKRDVSRNPLFDVMFVLQNTEKADIKIDNLNFIPYEPLEKTSKFDITLEANENMDGIEFCFEYCSKLFARQTIERFKKYYIHILKTVMNNPSVKLSEIELVDQDDKKQIFNKFNDKKVVYNSNKSIHELFEEQVYNTPYNTALIFEEKMMTYKELNESANKVAHHLREIGVKENSIVGVMVERSCEMIIGIFGILKAGGAYVPIDPNYPNERIQYLLNNSRTKILLTQEKLVQSKDFDETNVLVIEDILNRSDLDTNNLNIKYDSERLMYVLYTSGSTGNPKGVEIKISSFMNLLEWYTTEFMITEEDCVLLIAPTSFDLAQKNLYCSLIKGGKLCLFSTGLFDYKKMSNVIDKQRVTLLNCTPSAFNPLVDLNSDSEFSLLKSLKYVFLGGETINLELLKPWLNSPNCNVKIVNTYGPTECTDIASSYIIDLNEVESMKTVPIGKPIYNTQLYILDKYKRVLPVGVEGELYIAGTGLAKGYFNAPKLTEDRFIEIPSILNEKAYRTGDLARWLPDGNVEFLGRIDNQIKIRGFRIELGEIEAYLLKHELILDALVLDRLDHNGNKYLCGYIIAENELSTHDLREFLANSLPDYMIPTYFVFLDTMPLTPNGKIDRKALPLPDMGEMQDDQYEEPQSNIEKQMLDIWRDVLGFENIGINSNFFRLGGDSIKVIQVLARLNKLNLRLNPEEFLRYPTIKEQILYVCESYEEKNEQGICEGNVVLTPIQNWFFNRRIADMHHWNQAIMLHNKEGYDEIIINKVFEKIVEHHDALRMVYSILPDGVSQYNRGNNQELFDVVVTELMDCDDLEVKMKIVANKLQKSMDLTNGPLVKIGLFKTLMGDYLLIAIHHLIVDGVSWRIILEDFESGYINAKNNQEIIFQKKTCSYMEWAKRLRDYSNSKKLLKEVEYWKGIEESVIEILPVDVISDKNLYKDSAILSVELSEKETCLLLKDANNAYNTEINDLLITALSLAISEWTKSDKVLINLEGHGRESIIEDIDISRTVGWFTTLYPVIINLEQEDLSLCIKLVKETLRTIPNKGIGYGILKYLNPITNTKPIDFRLEPEICFNYLGQSDQSLSVGDVCLAHPYIGELISENAQRTYKVEIYGYVSGDKLQIFINYNKNHYFEKTIVEFLDNYKKHLVSLINHCTKKEG